MESQPDPLVGHVIARESVVEESACGIQEFRISPTHDDPSKRAGLRPKKRRAVRLDDDTSNGIEPQIKGVTSEPMDRNSDLHMLQEGS